MANKPKKGPVNFGKPSSKPVGAMPKSKNGSSKKK